MILHSFCKPNTINCMIVVFYDRDKSKDSSISFNEYGIGSISLIVAFAIEIEVHFRIDGMSVGLFPFFDDFCHISIGHFLISHGVLQRIGPVFGEEEVDDASHEDIEYEYIGVGILEDHEGGGQEHPDNDHKGDHGNDLLDHPHIGTTLLILVEDRQRVPIEVVLGVEVDEPEEVDQRVGGRVQ